jgi:hypothetical protein
MIKKEYYVKKFSVFKKTFPQKSKILFLPQSPTTWKGA